MNPPKLKRARRISLAEAQNWRCAYCGGDMSLNGDGPDLATVEHLWGRRRNNTLFCVSACSACNQTRGDMHCIWRFGELRRRLLQSGLWPACQKPSRAVVALLKAAVEAPFPSAADSAPTSFTNGCIGLCHDR